MAGLPRAGSSLLSALLNQNPNFYSGPSSPVLSTIYVIEDHLSQDELFLGYPKPQQAKEILSSVINHFYSDVEKPVVIDKNRAWTSRVPYIEEYIGQRAKILCPVRDVEDIFSSMLRMIRRNPYQEGNPRINFVDEQLIKNNIPLTDLNRCNFLASSQGILGNSINSMRECVEGYMRDRLHFVEYNNLVSRPQETLNAIYDFLGEERFEHDFQNVTNIHREDDLTVYGVSDMHEVRKVVKDVSPPANYVVPEEILQRCVGLDFWRRAII